MSRYGVMQNSPTFDYCGPMTWTVDDCAIVLQAIAGHDAKDPASAARPVPDYRAPLLPDLPTVAEAGVPGFAVDSWYALIGPRGLPRSTVERLNREVKSVLESAQVKERFAASGADAVSSSPEELLAFVKAEIAKWIATARKADIRLE